MIWTRANINPQSCLHAVNTLWVHWASTEDPERDLVPRVAKTSCSVGCSPYLVFFPNSPASGWCEGVTPQFPQSFYPWVPREKSCAPGVPCSSRSLWLDRSSVPRVSSSASLAGSVAPQHPALVTSGHTSPAHFWQARTLAIFFSRCIILQRHWVTASSWMCKIPSADLTVTQKFS